MLRHIQPVLHIPIATLATVCFPCIRLSGASSMSHVLQKALTQMSAVASTMHLRIEDHTPGGSSFWD